MNSKSIATMKNLFTRLMLVAVAAMGFVACQEGYEDVTITPEAKEIVMTFVAEAPDTRTSVAIDGDVAKYSWSEGDKVGFYYVAADVDYKKKGTSNKAVIADDGTATFTASFEENENATSYNIGAFYPGNSWMSHATENHFNNVKVKIFNEQILTDGSFDPAADLMMSKPFMDVALDEDAVKTLEFTRIAAIGKMNLKLTDMVEGEVIKSVKFTLADGIHFNGPVVLDLENSTYELGTTGTSNYVNLTGSLAANADRTAIFFTCFPGEYSGTYTIEVETDKATYSKTGELTKALTFTAGDVLNFNATVGERDEVEIPTDVYTLLTDVTRLDAGDKIIIAAAGYNYALSTTQNGNNRGRAAITKSGNTISFNNDVQILTVEAGTKASTFAFNTGSGYLYAASSGSNYLRTETTLSDNSSWTITIETDGTATIKAQGTNTRNWLRYNSSSSIFSCYASDQQDVVIYYLDGEPDTTPRFTVTPTEQSIGAEGGDIQFTVTSYNGAVVTAESSDTTWLTIDNTFKATVKANETAEARSAKITFSADGCDDVFVTVSQEGKSTESTYTKITSDSELTDGEYIIVYEGDSNVYVFNGVDAVNGYISASITNNDTISGTFADGEVTIAAMNGGYSLKVANGYMSGTSGSNKLNFGTTASANTFEFNADGTVKIISDTSVFTFNHASNQLRFRYYKSASYASMGAVTLYKKN